MKRHDVSKGPVDPRTKICPHCGAKNPSKAYVCLKCLKVMNRKEKFSIFNLYLPRRISVMVIVAAVLIVGIHYVHQYFSAMEANLTLKVRTTQYNVQVLAEKKTLEGLTKELVIESASPGDDASVITAAQQP